jgi:hypothetical protein
MYAYIVAKATRHHPALPRTRTEDVLEHRSPPLQALILITMDLVMLDFRGSAMFKGPKRFSTQITASFALRQSVVFEADQG